MQSGCQKDLFNGLIARLRQCRFCQHLGRSPNFRHRLLSGEAAIRDLSFENFVAHVSNPPIIGHLTEMLR